MNEARELPPGWILTTVRQIGQGGEQAVLTGPFGTSMGRSDFTDSGVPVLTIGCLTHQGVDLSKAMHVAPEKAAVLQRYQLRHGDLLFSRMATVGRASIVERRFEGALFNYHLMRLRLLPEAIDPRLFVYYVHGSQMVRDYVRSVNHGATRDGINTEQLLDLPVLLPPPRAQPSIVAAIDSHFSRLDSATATLERTQRNLERFRASVLKAAVEGRLVPTEAELAKKEGRSYEPASELLKRILAERRRRWEEAELAKLKAKGKSPTDDRWKKRYEEPATPDVSNLPELPDGWCWTTLDAIADVKGGLAKGKRRRPGEMVESVPYLRVANVQRGHLDLREVKSIEATAGEIAELALTSGDVLFNEGGDRDKLGRGWVWRAEIPTCIHQNHVFRARLLLRDGVPEFVSWYGNSNGQRYFFDEGKHTTNLASLSLTKLRSLPIPLPPVPEQMRIKSEVERLLSLAAEASCSRTSLQRIARLRQSILKWAFEGRLVAASSAAALAPHAESTRARLRS